MAMVTAAAAAVEVIHLWSSPRSVSTSLMYSFAQRDDTEVLDEPLYANHLRVTGAQRPYREELLSKMVVMGLRERESILEMPSPKSVNKPSQKEKDKWVAKEKLTLAVERKSLEVCIGKDCRVLHFVQGESDGNKVVKEIIFSPGPKKYRFCKHMASQHLPGLPGDLMKTGKHCILIRNPLDVLTSYEKVIPPSLTNLGYDSMVSIYSILCSQGQTPLVIDSDLLREDPEATLRGVCDYLGMPFQAVMLKWESGPKPFDGLWAPYWYKSTHESMGFEQPRKYPPPFPSSLYNLLEQSLPFYDLLKRYARHTTPKSPHPDLPVPANKKLLAWVGDEIVSRENAKVSVFDSVVQGGDAVWEGLRIYDGKIFKLEEHLDRLFDSTKALAFSNLPTREYVKEAIFKTLIRNGMFNNAHIRLTLTRGKKDTARLESRIVKKTAELFKRVSADQGYLIGSRFQNVNGPYNMQKAFLDPYTYNFFQIGTWYIGQSQVLIQVTSGMSPAFNLYGCCLIVLAEWKPPVYDNESGITLVTASTRRNSPNNLDSKIHHNNLLNNILAKIEGNNSHADDAIMLDKDGYVSETNATNIFLVKKGHVATPHADYCLPGITRGTVMELVVKEKLVLSERRISVSEFHTADEVFTTGTMGELTPVTKIDGRVVGDGKVGPVTRRLQNAHKKLTAESGVPIPTYQQP